MESAPTAPLQLPHDSVLLSLVGFIEHSLCEIGYELWIGGESQ
jgi:hypothetical protein